MGKLFKEQVNVAAQLITGYRRVAYLFDVTAAFATLLPNQIAVAAAQAPSS